MRLEEGWSTLFLVWLLIASTAAALGQAELTEGLYILGVVGTAGVGTGLLLAKSRFSNRRAHLFALLYGLAIIVFMVGRTLPEEMTWRMRILDLFQREADWLSKAFRGGRSADNLIFVLQTSIIFWLLGYTAAWYTFRKPRVWRVILPSGVVLLSVVYYYQGPRPLTIFLAVYVLLALLYGTRSHLMEREKGWRAASIRYEGDIQINFMRASLVIGVILLLLASNMPALGASPEVHEALTDVDRPWRRFQDNWTRLFSSLRSYGSGVNDVYSDSMTLGGPRSVSNTLIMDVYTPRPLPYAYWQGVVLDTYNGYGDWRNNTEKTLLVGPEKGDLNVPFSVGRNVITHTVVNYIPSSSTIFGAPEVVASNQPLLVDLAPDRDGRYVVNWIRSRYVLNQGDSYQVVSRMSTADEQSLRFAEDSYPEWISENYLQVPESVSSETRHLARKLTAPYDNPYDKAIAVRDYLRSEITYNDQIAAPPGDVEPIDYVLFELKEGYCTYYASAMAIMLRSVGIPTRIVNGYSQGEYVDDIGAYRVRASNAHTWVEVYFPQFGWIQFEPTAALPLVDRPETPPGNAGDAFPDPDIPGAADGAETANRVTGEERLEDDPTSEGLGSRAGLLLHAVVGSALLTLAGGVVVVANHFNRAIETNVEKSYGRLGSWARWLGVLFNPGDTPYERADRLTEVVPEGRKSINNLTQHYVVRRFSPPNREPEKYDVQKEWQILRPLLLRKSLALRWERLKERFSWRL
ncbi:MAG: transglutaminase-like domain-containing protein [Candidatus Promineifilaceae bacterium]|nr:transglutaminase-like domain-containing protein [Candidatus Promineifilaceae bacterium]